MFIIAFQFYNITGCSPQQQQQKRQLKLKDKSKRNWNFCWPSARNYSCICLEGMTRN